MAQANAIDLFAWQIGSRVPPKVCLCCGRAFSAERERKGPYKGPYIWVCSECWANQFLFFPDKTSMLANATLLRGIDNSKDSDYTNSRKLLNGGATVDVTVIRMGQGDLVLYSGVMPAEDLLEVYSVYRWSSEELENGYQRDLWEDRARKIAD